MIRAKAVKLGENAMEGECGGARAVCASAGSVEAEATCAAEASVGGAHAARGKRRVDDDGDGADAAPRAAAAAAAPVGLLAIARARNAVPGGEPESDLFTALLPAEPAADALLRCLGFDGLGS